MPPRKIRVTPRDAIAISITVAASIIFLYLPGINHPISQGLQLHITIASIIVLIHVWLILSTNFSKKLKEFKAYIALIILTISPLVLSIIIVFQVLPCFRDIFNVDLDTISYLGVLSTMPLNEKYVLSSIVGCMTSVLTAYLLTARISK